MEEERTMICLLPYLEASDSPYLHPEANWAMPVPHCRLSIFPCGTYNMSGPGVVLSAAGSLQKQYEFSLRGLVRSPGEPRESRLSLMPAHTRPLHSLTGLS